MALEDSINQLDISVRELTKALQLNAAAPLSGTPVGAVPDKKPSKKAEAAPAAKVSTVTPKEVADAIVNLANTVSRDAAVGVLAQFKVSRASELKAEQLADALKAAKAAQAAAAAPAPTSDSLV